MKQTTKKEICSIYRTERQIKNIKAKLCQKFVSGFQLRCLDSKDPKRETVVVCLNDHYTEIAWNNDPQNSHRKIQFSSGFVWSKRRSTQNTNTATKKYHEESEAIQHEKYLRAWEFKSI